MQDDVAKATGLPPTPWKVAALCHLENIHHVHHSFSNNDPSFRLMSTPSLAITIYDSIDSHQTHCMSAVQYTHFTIFYPYVHLNIYEQLLASAVIHLLSEVKRLLFVLAPFWSAIIERVNGNKCETTYLKTLVTFNYEKLMLNVS